MASKQGPDIDSEKPNGLSVFLNSSRIQSKLTVRPPDPKSKQLCPAAAVLGSEKAPSGLLAQDIVLRLQNGFPALRAMMHPSSQRLSIYCWNRYGLTVSQKKKIWID
jgi:hypothetical protein